MFWDKSQSTNCVPMKQFWWLFSFSLCIWMGSPLSGFFISSSKVLRDPPWIAYCRGLRKRSSLSRRSSVVRNWEEEDMLPMLKKKTLEFYIIQIVSYFRYRFMETRSSWNECLRLVLFSAGVSKFWGTLKAWLSSGLPNFSCKSSCSALKSAVNSAPMSDDCRYFKTTFPQ